MVILMETHLAKFPGTWAAQANSEPTLAAGHLGRDRPGDGDAHATSSMVTDAT